MTTEYNDLPKISGINTANVPRDINALADAVDELIGDMPNVNTTSKNVAGAINEIESKVTSVQGEIDTHIGTGGSAHATATQSVAGFMTASDKTKLDSIATGANNYTHPNHTGDVISFGDGMTAISAGVIVNADISASAAINASKIADGSISNTEFQYLDGVTSTIQTQLNAKAPLSNPSLTGTVGMWNTNYTGAWLKLAGRAENNSGGMILHETDGDTEARFIWGEQVPEGLYTAPPGSMYLRITSGSSFGRLYIKESGSGNTGWILK